MIWFSLFHQHDWDKWSEESRADVKKGEHTIGRIFIQKRVCADCGFAQRKAQRIWIDNRIESVGEEGRSAWERIFGHKANDWEGRR